MGNCKIIQTIVDDGESECIKFFPINNVANITNVIIRATHIK
jgi:hypothetical protein